jgi:hypothetical protein
LVLAAVGLLVAACGPGGTPAADRAAEVADVPAVTTQATPSPSPTASVGALVAPMPTGAPQVLTKTVTETKRIAYKTRTVTDSGLAAGTKRVRTKGVDGVRTLTYEVTLTDGRQSAKRLLRDVVTTQPVTRVLVVGTKEASASRCDPNYSGCVPIASDVDCAGGSGNGPAYVQGPVRVTGSDIYDLDRDGDGYGCED